MPTKMERNAFFAFNAFGNHPNTWIPLDDQDTCWKAVDRGEKCVSVDIGGKQFEFMIEYKEKGDVRKAIGGKLVPENITVRRMVGDPAKLKTANASAACLMNLALQALRDEDATPAKRKNEAKEEETTKRKKDDA